MSGFICMAIDCPAAIPGELPGWCDAGHWNAVRSRLPEEPPLTLRCPFFDQFGTHADMLGRGDPSCCAAGPDVFDLGKQRDEALTPVVLDEFVMAEVASDAMHDRNDLDVGIPDLAKAAVGALVAYLRSEGVRIEVES